MRPLTANYLTNINRVHQTHNPQHSFFLSLSLILVLSLEKSEPQQTRQVTPTKISRLKVALAQRLFFDARLPEIVFL